MTREEEIEELRKDVADDIKHGRRPFSEDVACLSAYDLMKAALERMSEGLDCGDRGCEGVEIARAALTHLKEPIED